MKTTNKIIITSREKKEKKGGAMAMATFNFCNSEYELFFDKYN